MNHSTEQMMTFITEEADSLKKNLASPLLDRNYWRKPELGDVLKGDDSADLIYHAIGYALTQWEVVENTLVQMYFVFCELESTASLNAIRRSFGTFESSAGRRLATIEAAKVYFGEDVFSTGAAKPFKKFFDAHQEATKRRNDIAHGTAYPIIINNESKGCFLFPSQYNTGRNSTFFSSEGGVNTPYMTETYRYNSDVIYSFAKKFGELNSLAFNFLLAANKINGVPKIILADVVEKKE